jgi:aspartyl-tRNA(Asn)/glutamyl-tRNA(Gln) amidotransferase subunit A
MSAELCNNVSRYDGVKYGYRTQNYTGIDELYTNSRTEAFGDFLKAAILFGSETLSTENYQKVYDKALRVRRVISEAMNALLADCDALLMPAVSTLAYDKAMVENDKYLPYKENFYTAPASITGLPVVVAGGVQLVGAAFSEDVLLDLAELV